MKPFLIIFISAAVVCLLSFPGFSFAKAGESVYASAEEQQLVYEMLEKDYPTYARLAVKDSIAPVYDFDLLGYRAEDSIVLRASKDGMYRYCMKATADKDKGFAGTGIISVTISGGKIESAGAMYPGSEYERVLSASPDYADYAEDIRIVLGRDSIIPPQNVRFVCANGIGNCFYINDGRDSVFVSLLNLNVSWADPYHVDFSVGDDCDFVVIRAGEELESVAKAALQKKEYVDKNGESGAGGSGLAFVPDTALAGVRAENFRDVTDIASYLGQDHRSASMVFPNAFAPKRPVWPFFAAGGAVMLLAALAAGAVLLVRKKRAVKGA